MDNWENALPRYSIAEMQKQPDAESWSIGQVYVHLINATLNFHLGEVRKCMRSLEHRTERKNMKRFVSFKVLGGFPPIPIKVPASTGYTPTQPTGKDEIAKGLANVRDEMARVVDDLKSIREQGKTKHPGLGYLDADEWCKLVEMHFRHHLRQRARLDKFLAQ